MISEPLSKVTRLLGVDPAKFREFFKQAPSQGYGQAQGQGHEQRKESQRSGSRQKHSSGRRRSSGSSALGRIGYIGHAAEKRLGLGARFGHGNAGLGLLGFGGHGSPHGGLGVVAGPTPSGHKLLVLLNRETFEFDALHPNKVTEFNANVRGALNDGHQSLLVHDRRGSRVRDPFEDLLLAAGNGLERDEAARLFNTVAIQWHHAPHESVCMVQVSRLGM